MYLLSADPGWPKGVVVATDPNEVGVELLKTVPKTFPDVWLLDLLLALVLPSLSDIPPKGIEPPIMGPCEIPKTGSLPLLLLGVDIPNDSVLPKLGTVALLAVVPKDNPEVDGVAKDFCKNAPGVAENRGLDGFKVEGPLSLDPKACPLLRVRFSRFPLLPNKLGNGNADEDALSASLFSPKPPAGGDPEVFDPNKDFEPPKRLDVGVE